MPLGNWIEYTAELAQRLGHLKAIVIVSSPSKVTDAAGINSQLSKLLTRRVTVPGLDPAVKRYFRYRKSKGVSAAIDIQDCYLSDPGIPSQTGALTKSAFRDSLIPNLASEIHLLHSNNYSLTPLGQVLIHLIGEEEASALRQYNQNVNPFLLTTEQKVFFLYCLLRSDGDVLRRLYSRLLSRTGWFHRSEAGNELVEVFREIASDYSKKSRSGRDVATVQKLREYAHAIESQPNTSHSGVREQRTTVRLETFVDMGLLEKEDPTKYTYRFTPIGTAFIRDFIQAADVDSFLLENFFKSANQSFGCGAKPIYECKDLFLQLLFPGHSLLASGLGYAPLHETLLLTVLTNLGGNQRTYFEISWGMQAIKEVQKAHPDDIRFNVNRQGEIRYVKLSRGLYRDTHS